MLLIKHFEKEQNKKIIITVML